MACLRSKRRGKLPSLKGVAASEGGPTGKHAVVEFTHLTPGGPSFGPWHPEFHRISLWIVDTDKPACLRCAPLALNCSAPPAWNYSAVDNWI